MYRPARGHFNVGYIFKKINADLNLSVWRIYAYISRDIYKETDVYCHIPYIHIYLIISKGMFIKK